MAAFHSFLSLNNISLCMCVWVGIWIHGWTDRYFLYLSFGGHIGCFHSLATVNNAAKNIEGQVSLWDTESISLGNKTKSKIAG